MKRFLVIATAGLLTLASIPQALGQYGDEPPPRLALKIGIYRPSGDVLGSALGSNWKLLGLQYGLSFDEFERPTAYATVQMSSDDSENFEADMLGIEYNRLWWVRQSEEGSAYFGAGTGLYSLKQKDRPVAFMGWTERSGTKLGFTGVVGYEFEQGYFAEIRYIRIGELARGMDFSGLSLSVGARLSF